MSVTAMSMALGVKGISPRAKLVLIAVANSADEATFFGYPSRRHLADAADCSVDTVDRCLRELADAGLLTKEERDRADGRGQTSNLFRIFPEHDPSRKSAATPSRENAEGGQRRTAQGGAEEVRPPQPQAYAAPPAARDAAPKEPLSEPSNVVAVVAPGSDFKSMIREAQARAGAACNLTSGHVHHVADLRRLIDAGCDWDADVLPAIDALSAGIIARKAKPINSWAHPGLVDAATTLRDRRLAGLPAPTKPTERTNGRSSAERDAWDSVLSEMEGDAASRTRPSVALGGS